MGKKKNPPIRWRKKDVDLLEKSIKNYNAKLRRMESKYGDSVITGNRERKKAALANIKTRDDFNSFIREMQSFTRRNSKGEKIVKSDRYGKMTTAALRQLERLEKLNEERKAENAKKLNKKPVKIKGQPTGYNQPAMGTVEQNENKPSSAKWQNKSHKELQRHFKALDDALNETKSLERKKLMMDNYIKGLKDYNFLDVRPDLEQLIKSVDLDTFYETLKTDISGSFEWYKSQEEFEARLEYIIGTWEAAAEESAQRKASGTVINYR